MLKTTRKITPFYIFSDLVFMGLSFCLAYFYRYNDFLSAVRGKVILPNLREYLFIFILWAVFVIIFFKQRELYATDRGLTLPKEIRKIIIGVFCASLLIVAIIFFTKYKFFSRSVFLRSFILLCVLLSGWRAFKRVVLRKLISGGFRNVNVLIIGAGKAGKAIVEEIKRNPHWGFKVIGFLDDQKQDFVDNMPVLGKLNKLSINVKRYFIDEVIVSIPSERKAVSEAMKQVKEMSLGLRIIPENFEEPLPVLNINYLGVIPLITYRERMRHPAEFALKRLFDFFVSLILLILLVPFFVIVAIVIKLDSKGPVFYIQKRTGLKGNVFNFYKIRSMVKGADKLKEGLMDKNESKGGIIFKIRQDPRITNIGRFLRRYSLDELPQIFNVLKGDMSLVGPRPFPVIESQKLEHNHLERLRIRPGITGLAQVRGRSDLSFYRWAKWDLWYVNNWSFWLDFLILWKTIPVVFKAKGAY